ncbi:GntR family transcriptional regulator [Novosphingobium sp. Gsoil 351]|uniref:GntR family transcriptional regulator n=1 Tax=Novosphingobium sp. Gsoil 351 TaxID=2675225 RepID=UPI0018A7EACB|nr:GntR family transcriptional regulator [Novosphingobium sp. Gsoil 351]
MSPGPTFDRVYRELKGRLMTAEFAPGEHLEPVALGEKLHASATPVRDALQRLAGERLVDAPLHEGFRTPAPTEPDLRDLLEWSAKLVDLALRRVAPAAVATSDNAPFATPHAPESADEIFLAIVRTTGSDEHVAAVAGLFDRLAALRTVEHLVFDDVAEEYAELHLTFASGNLVELRRAVAAYHRRRQRAAPDLLAALRRETGRRR